MLAVPGESERAGGEGVDGNGRPRGRAFTVNSSRRTRLYLGDSSIRLLTAYSFTSDRDFRQDGDVVLEVIQPQRGFWSVYSLVIYLVVIPIYAGLGVVERSILASGWKWEESCVSLDMSQTLAKVMRWFLILRSAVAVLGILGVVLFLIVLKNAGVYIKYMRFWCRLNLSLVVWTAMFSCGVLIFQRKTVSGAVSLFLLSLSVIPVFGGLDFLVFHDSATRFMTPALRFFAMANGYLSIILYIARRVQGFECGARGGQPGAFYFIGNALFGFVEAGYLIQVIKIMYQKLLRPSTPCVTFRIVPEFSDKASAVLGPLAAEAAGAISEADLEEGNIIIGYRDNRMRVFTSMDKDILEAEGKADSKLDLITVSIKGLRKVDWIINLWSIAAIILLLPAISIEYVLYAARIQLVVSRECWILRPVTRVGNISAMVSMGPPLVNILLLAMVLARAKILVAFLRWVRHWLRCNFVSAIAGLVWALGAFVTVRREYAGFYIFYRFVNTFSLYLVFALLDLILMLYIRRVPLLRPAAIVFFLIVAIINPINYASAIAQGNLCDPPPPTSKFQFFADKAGLMSQAFFILRVLSLTERKFRHGLAAPNMGNYRGPKTYMVTDMTTGLNSVSGRRLVERSPSVTPVSEAAFV